MSLKFHRFRSLNFRFTVFFAAVFTLCTAAVFAIAYLLLSSSAQAEEQRLLNSRLLEFWAVYETGGAQAVLRERSLERFSRPFLIRIATGANRTLYRSIPIQWEDFETGRLSQVMPATSNELLKISSSTRRDSLFVKSIPMDNGNILQIGISNEQRIDLLRRYRRIFLLIALPLIAISSFGGLLFSTRSLKPIRSLLKLIRNIIDTGDMSQRIPQRSSGDELDELVMLSNTMLAKIEALIDGMKNSLDNVAHDLRTPLSRLRISAEMALQSNEGYTSTREALSVCIEESEQILTMLNTLMDISEAESGVMRLEKRPVDLCAMIDDIAELYGYFAEDKKITLSCSCDSAIQVTIDLNRIRQVIANILDNAVKYTSVGGSIEILASRKNGRAIITIADTGMGIAADDLPHIWERLYRGDQSRSEPGLGLGLGLVKAIVEAHDGIVDVESEPGRGSQFTVTLPA